MSVVEGFTDDPREVPLAHWAFFDLSPLGDGETWAGALSALAREAGWPAPVRRGLDALARSTRGFWLAEEAANGDILLRELVTGARCRCGRSSHLPSSAFGQVWLARVLPSPAPRALLVLDPAPIALPGATEDVIRERVHALLADVPADERPAAYPLLMKFGPDPDYWLDVIVDLLRGGSGTERGRPHRRARGSAAGARRSSSRKRRARRRRG